MHNYVLEQQQNSRSYNFDNRQVQSYDKMYLLFVFEGECYKDNMEIKTEVVHCSFT